MCRWFPWWISWDGLVLCVGLVRVRRRLECLKRRSRMGVFLVSSEVGWFWRYILVSLLVVLGDFYRICFGICLTVLFVFFMSFHTSSRWPVLFVCLCVNELRVHLLSHGAVFLGCGIWMHIGGQAKRMWSLEYCDAPIFRNPIRPAKARSCPGKWRC